MRTNHAKLRPELAAKGSGPSGKQSHIRYQISGVSSLLQNQEPSSNKGKGWKCWALKDKGGLGMGARAGEPPPGADRLPGRTQGATKLEAGNLSPRQTPSRARGREGRGWAGVGAEARHTDMPPRPPCPHPADSLHTWSGSARWQSWSAKSRTIFAPQILLHPYRGDARGERFHVLWSHRCSTRWFQQSLELERSPPVPIKHLRSSPWPGDVEDTGECVESRPFSSKGKT